MRTWEIERGRKWNRLTERKVVRKRMEWERKTKRKERKKKWGRKERTGERKKTREETQEYRSTQRHVFMTLGNTCTCKNIHLQGHTHMYTHTFADTNTYKCIHMDIYWHTGTRNIIYIRLHRWWRGTLT